MLQVFSPMNNKAEEGSFELIAPIQFGQTVTVVKNVLMDNQVQWREQDEYLSYQEEIGSAVCECRLYFDENAVYQKILTESGSDVLLSEPVLSKIECIILNPADTADVIECVEAYFAQSGFQYTYHRSVDTDENGEHYIKDIWNAKIDSVNTEEEVYGILQKYVNEPITFENIYVIDAIDDSVNDRLIWNGYDGRIIRNLLQLNQ